MNRQEALFEHYKKFVKPHFEARDDFIKNNPQLETQQQKNEFYRLEENCAKALKEHELKRFYLFGE